MVVNFVHVGLPKAASTFLQRAVFSKHSEIEYLGKNFVDQDLKEVNIRIPRQHSFVFDTDHARALFQERISASSKPVSLYSEEDLVGMKFLDVFTMASRLADVMGEYKVIFVPREQFDWIQSKYYFYLANYRPVAFGGLDKMIKQDNFRRVGTNWGPLYLFEIARCYAKVVGKENVKILPYEMLKKDKPLFISELSSFLGVDSGEMEQLFQSGENRKKDKIRISPARASFIKLLNHYVEGGRNAYFEAVNWAAGRHLASDQLRTLEGLLQKENCDLPAVSQWVTQVLPEIPDDIATNGKAKDPLSKSAIRKVMNVAVPTNQKLAAEFDVDLGRYGYAMK